MVLLGKIESHFILLSNENLSWNIKGASRKGFLAQLNHLILDHKPDILALMKTKVSLSKARKFFSRINFPNSLEIAPEGYSRGIWLF